MRVKNVKIPPRIAAKPNPADWGDDLLTLPEAAALLWPRGPITAATLRTAKDEGTLNVREIAGKHFVTVADLRRMGERQPAAPEDAPAKQRRKGVRVGERISIGAVPKPGADDDYDELMRVLDIAHERLFALRAAARKEGHDI